MKRTSGFTLIELLVVIAIISLLSSVVLASLSGARESARDTRRATDFRQLRTAMQQYYNDHGQHAGEQKNPDNNEVDKVSENCKDQDLYEDLVEEGYLKTMITDPVNDKPNDCNLADDGLYYYAWDEANAGGTRCFAINNFESGSVPESLQPLNHQDDAGFGGDANFDNAAFTYCFRTLDD